MKTFNKIDYYSFNLAKSKLLIKPKLKSPYPTKSAQNFPKISYKNLNCSF